MLFKLLLIVSLSLISSICHSERTISEGKPSTGNSIYVSSNTTEVILGASTTYYGTVPNVNLYVTSNTVLGNGCVIYSTGSLVCLNLYGNGSSLTTPAYIPIWAKDDLRSQANGTTHSFSLSHVPISTNSVNVVLDHLTKSTTDYNLTGTTLVMSTAPATLTYQFYIQYQY